MKTGSDSAVVLSLKKAVPLLSLVALPLVLAGPLFAAWSSTTLDGGLNGRLVISSTDVPHVAYYGDVVAGEGTSLKYAVPDGGVWSTQTVDTDARGDYAVNIPAIDLDASERVVIAYRGNSTTLKLAQWTGVAWSTQTVDASGGVDYKIAMKVDPSGTIHILYRARAAIGTTENLRYAYGDGVTWTLGILDSDDGVTPLLYSPCLELDASGRPRILYDTSQGVKYGVWSGAVLTTTTVSSLGGFRFDMKIDGSNSVHVVGGTGGGLPSTLTYARLSGGTWNLWPSAVITESALAAIALDASNVPQIVYSDMGALPANLNFVQFRSAFTAASLVTATLMTAADAALETDSVGDLHLLHGDFTTDYVVVYSSSPPISLAAPGTIFTGDGPSITARIYPNPASPTVAAPMTIDSLPAGAELKIFTVRGALVKKLEADATGTTIWDGTDEGNQAVPSGAYYLLVDSGGETRTFKMGIQR